MYPIQCAVDQDCLQELISHARRHSRYYAQAFAHLPDQGNTLSQLPLLDTARFWHIDGDVGQWHALTAPPDDAYIFRSGGSTGQSKLSICSRAEWQRICSRYGAAIGTWLVAGDRVANLFFSGNLYASHLFIHASLSHVPVAISQYPFAGHTELDILASSLRQYAITVLAVVPTHLLLLADHLELHGATLPKVRLILYGGDSLFPDCLPLLSRVFPNAVCHSIGYASVEIGVLGGSEPGCDAGEHRCFDGESLLEILDEASGQPIEQSDRPGLLVATSLSRRLTPLIRCPTGDLAAWREPPGPHRKFVLAGRSMHSHQVRVGGYASLIPASIERCIAETLGRAVLWQMQLSRRSALDHVLLRIAAHADDETRQALSARIIVQQPGLAELIQARQLVLDFDWCSPAALELDARTGKLRRIIDRRDRRLCAGEGA